MKKNIHVARAKNNRDWAVKSAGSTKAYRNVSTQLEAIAIGKSIAKHNKSELLIHGRDGKIREKNSYGKDNFPPKG